MSKFDWILFDVDDTLLDFTSAAREAFSSMLVDLGLPEQEGYFLLYKVCNHEAWQAYEKGEINAVDLRRKRFADFKDRAGLSKEMDPLAMNAAYMENLIRHTAPLEGALEILETLQSKKVRMGIITNGLKEVQRPRIRRVGMEKFFDVVLVSDEIGLAKPDIRFFALAHEAMGLPDKEKVLVVGDSYASDITGAKNYAFPSCWFNPHAQSLPQAEVPDFEIRSLQELIGLVS
jgi:YjjG family noncanonical pyrimidine nucleotidase